MSRAMRCRVALAVLVLLGPTAQAESTPPQGVTDARIRSVVWREDEVYRLSGHVGYLIDLQFAADERFVGLAAGDIDGIGFEAQGNHLFLKPKAARFATNLTILTDRRAYHLDYRATPGAASDPTAMYAVRFGYPEEEARALIADAAAREERARLATALDAATTPRNLNYAFCGPKTLRPDAAWDDAVQTHLTFGTRAELPAVFLRNEDGTESLVNVTVTSDGLIVQRIARQFILRRGRLVGCVVNRAFTGSAERLPTGTLSPQVQRATPTVRP